MSPLPHPTVLALSNAEIDERFQLLTVRSCPDPIWHFTLAVPKDAEPGAPGDVAPSPDAPIQTLALFQRKAPEVDLEVTAQRMVREVDPADWLDHALAQKPELTIVSRQAQKTEAGWTGDTLATWTFEGEPFVGRFYAAKAGPRLYMLCMRTREADYARVADDFVVSMGTLDVLDHSLGPLSENVVTIAETSPVPHEAHLPTSWRVARQPPAPHGAAFQASLQPLGGGHGVEGGDLVFAMVDKSAADRPRDVARAVLSTVRGSRWIVQHEDFEEEPADEPFQKSWYLASPATSFKGAAGEVRCRVMLSSRVWVVAGVVGPTRDDAPFCWMQNKRALDIATSTLTFENSDGPR